MGEISVPKFEVGMAIEEKFMTPDNGRPTMNIKDSSGNILLHVNPRWDQKAFVLNTYKQNSWGREERPSGFDFDSGVPITIRVEAKSDHFVILVNGNIIHNYNYRLPVTDIRNITWNWSGEPLAAKLISLSVFY